MNITVKNHAITLRTSDAVFIGEHRAQQMAQEVADYLVKHYEKIGTSEIYYSTTGNILVVGHLLVDHNNASLWITVSTVNRESFVELTKTTQITGIN